MNVKIEKSWQEELKPEFEKDYFKNLISFVKEEYATQTIYPPGSQIFNAFDKCPFDQVKVVLIGQDPYHGPGQAHGLAFSVNDGVTVPPSLRNIFKEIHDDLGKPIPKSGNLERWAKQGVLLLNATLTVRANTPGSHQKKGWEEFTDAVIEIVSEKKENLVFMLWGAYAQKKGVIIEQKRKHFILKAAHPSPFAADKGFFGCRHFSQANAYLKQHGLSEIDW
ncbi:MAG: uracil-DNA glycosylase [Bacteroidota bacterium]|nr:uracil-DNA glycosylase [Bacteroidota bacterium]